MELTSEQQAVLDIFKAHEIVHGQYLPVQTLNQERESLSERAQSRWVATLRSLINSGYLAYHPAGYGLTEKGHFLIYQPSD